LNVTPPVQDAHDLYSIRNRTVESKVFADDNTSNIGSNIFPRDAETRLGRNEFPPFLYPIKQSVRGGCIFPGDTGPDFDKVFFGLRTS
jgi:hypothetical protein